ncbi:4'-phosphopantetheinyl transferase family protein [Streptomyces sp. NPDC001930]|uniref:4'-phosphopantetheinyl transferase family protein n=1 Tax=Streptomyces sp. NPDC001930 TaxID=3364625 RepID=UPI00367643D2
MPLTHPLPPPRHILGLHGPWGPLRADLARTGTALAYSRCTDWPLGEDAAVHALLGEEAARWERTRALPSGRRLAASRALLKHAVSAVTGMPATGLELAARPGGAPYLRGCDRIAVSLSHTEDVVLVCLTTVGQAGVDVERTDRLLLRAGMEREICTPAELARLRLAPAGERNAMLLRLWTLKEAFTKALGQGLRFSLGDFGFCLQEPHPRLQFPDGRIADAGAWTFAVFEPVAGCTISAALLTDGRPRLPAGPVPLADHEAARWCAAPVHHRAGDG